MAAIYIAEHATQGRDVSGYTLQNGTPQEPPTARQTVAITGASVQSAVLNASTTLVRVHTDVVCSIEIAANPTATTTNRRMAANTTEQIAVQPGSGYRLAVIANT